MKLIEIKKDEHYIVVDDSEIKEAEIKEGDWIYNVEREPSIIQCIGKGSLRGWRKITHSTQPLFTFNPHNYTDDEAVRYFDFINGHSSVKPLSLSEVEEATNGYSVEKMMILKLKPRWKHLFINGDILSKPYPTFFQKELDGLIEGFNACKELMKDKLFTEKHMKMLFAYAHSIGMNTVLQIQSPHLLSEQDTDNLRDEFIQSLLPKTEWECYFDEQGKLKLI